MKRIAALIVTALVLVAAYKDLTAGSIPIAEEQVIEVQSTPVEEVEGEAAQTLPYFEVLVAPGDNVLSIVENNLAGPLPVSMTQLVADFKALNDGTRPEELKYGKTYRFPHYKNE